MKINCPHCGAEIKNFKSTLMSPLINCDYCLSSFMLESDVCKQSLLIQLKKMFTINSQPFIALKLTQHHHDEGVRMDYLVKDKKGHNSLLITEDENIALVQITRVTLDNKKLNWSSLLPNSQVELFGKQWLVTQKRALNGKNKQTYLGNQSAELLILSFEKNGTYCQQGKWLDAFEISHED